MERSRYRTLHFGGSVVIVEVEGVAHCGVDNFA
jgi:hypothetical protein